jgi:type III secretory pathway component EscV
MKRWPASPFAGRRADVALAVLVVAMVAMMIVPMPTPLLDLCIALNLTLGVLLVATALYLRDVLSFAAFPTLLLLATLYRLALNVSSTRLILLQADAGRVIDAFGSFVVRGDYVVGALVFVVLTLVQFIVIARGAERVAEVGARFSLDAMPGKQLAIDADLRAGSLSAEGARVLRKKLERESQLYGALDGAMKFVKGDAIAGIVITLVNVLGGVSLGVFARGLELTQSLKLYGLLTIGDGLVTQIPALLSATSAGLVVTRVAAADGESSLGREIAAQLFGDARVLTIGALLLSVLALVPELPMLPFGTAAGLCGLLALRASRRARLEPDDAFARPQAAERPEPLSVELGGALAERLLPRGVASQALLEALDAARARLVRELGVTLAAPALRASSQLAPNAFRWLWRELPDAPRAVPAGQAPEPAVADALLELTYARAEDCVGIEEVQRMLDAVERERPVLVRLTVPRMISLPLLSQVLKVLVRERVSVRWLSEILEAVAPLAEQEPRAELLAEHARRALSRRISSGLAPAGTLCTLRLSPAAEEAIDDAIKRDGGREWLALSPGLAEEIVTEVAAAHRRIEEPHALVTRSVLRRHIRTLLQDSVPALAVVCPEELSPALQLVAKATVGP